MFSIKKCSYFSLQIVLLSAIDAHINIFVFLLSTPLSWSWFISCSENSSSCFSMRRQLNQNVKRFIWSKIRSGYGIFTEPHFKNSKASFFLGYLINTLKCCKQFIHIKVSQIILNYDFFKDLSQCIDDKAQYVF